MAGPTSRAEPVKGWEGRLGARAPRGSGASSAVRRQQASSHPEGGFRSSRAKRWPWGRRRTTSQRADRLLPELGAGVHLRHHRVLRTRHAAPTSGREGHPGDARGDSRSCAAEGERDDRRRLGRRQFPFAAALQECDSPLEFGGIWIWRKRLEGRLGSRERGGQIELPEQATGCGSAAAGEPPADLAGRDVSCLGRLVGRRTGTEQGQDDLPAVRGELRWIWHRRCASTASSRARFRWSSRMTNSKTRASTVALRVCAVNVRASRWRHRMTREDANRPRQGGARRPSVRRFSHCLSNPIPRS